MSGILRAGAAAPGKIALAELGKIKGVAFGEFLLWYERAHGRAAVESAVEAAEARHAEGLEPRRAGFGVLASRWYPAALVHELVDALTHGRTPAELEAMASDAADHIMGRTLRGVYRAVFSMFGTPERYRRYIGKLWSMHYDTGTVTVLAPEPGLHRVLYAGWAGHHPFICRMNMASSRTIYGAMGCKSVVYERTRCLSEHSRECENTVRWSSS